jgi:phospholipid/cholesterol/gamma-HCH transport system substrate-binding protein
MATIRNQTIKLGAFVVLVVAVLVLSLLLVGGLHVWKRVDTYHVVTSEAVSGIDLESAVTMRGVEIGKVTAIELDRSDFGRVRIDLEIDPGIELPADSKAYFQRVGVTGQRAIDITGGTLAGGRLAPGSTIPRGETTLEALESRASELTDELSILVADARQTVQHTKMLVTAVDPERVAAIVRAVDPERVRAIVAHTEHTMKTLESTSEALARGVSEGRADLEDVTHDVRALAERGSTVLEHVDGASVELSRLVVGATTLLNANEDDIRVTIGNIRRISQDARALARALRTQPSLLLRSTPPKERKLP